MRVLAVSELLSTIDQFLAGRLDAAGLEEWAEQREMSEDIEYDEADAVAIAETIFLLANPVINGAITAEQVHVVRARLQRCSQSTEPSAAADAGV